MFMALAEDIKTICDRFLPYWYKKNIRVNHFLPYWYQKHEG